MGFLFDFFIPALIILAVAFVWLRALLSKFIPPGRPGAPQVPRGTAPHPRSLASSGGFQAEKPAPQAVTRSVPTQRQWQGYEPTGDVEAARPLRQASQTNAESGWLQRHPRVAETAQARLLAKALDNPASARTAFLIKEVLEPPVGLRE